MSKKKKKIKIGSPYLKAVMPRRKKVRKCFRKRMRFLENSLIQELSYELNISNSKNNSILPFDKNSKNTVCKTSSSNQLFFADINNEVDSNISNSFLNKTIDLCMDESSDCVTQQILEPKSEPEILIDLCKDSNDDVVIINENLKKPSSFKIINLDDDDGLKQNTSLQTNEADDDVLIIGASKQIPLSSSASNKINNFVKCCIQMKKKQVSSKRGRYRFNRENYQRIPYCDKNVQEKRKHLKLYQPTKGKLGANIYAESPLVLPEKGLRPIIIDGSNVAYGFHKDQQFSCKRLEICIKYFKERGHKVIAFVPQFRTLHSKSDDPELLNKMARDGDVILTPSKRVEGKNIVPYDDRFIVQTAVLQGGIIVTRDNYRDLLQENPEWAETINYRTLPYTWVDNILMFPKDPLGENGPSLEEFLRFN